MRHRKMTSNPEKVQIPKQTFLETLGGISSPDVERRVAARKELTVLGAQATDELGAHLIACIVDANSPPKIVESASDVLEYYVQTHWCSTADNFKPPEIGLETKTEIKTGLLHGLYTLRSEARREIVSTITFIALLDWPDQWPDLFDTLVKHLNAGDRNSTIGSMLVMTDVIGLLSRAQLSNVGPVILREIYGIFNDDENTLTMRAHATRIFENIVVCMSSEEPERVREYLEPPMAMFWANALDRLKMEDDALTEVRLKLMIIEVVRIIVEIYPKCFSTVLPTMVTLIWKVLSACARLYQKYMTNTGKKVPKKMCDLVLSIFNFIETIMNGNRYRRVVRHRYSLPDYEWLHLQHSLPLEALQHIIVFAQMTDNLVKHWTQNPGRIVEEEFVDNIMRLDYRRVRSRAQNIMLKIVRCSGGPPAAAFCDIILTKLKGSDGTTLDRSMKWWKSHEASFEVFRILKDDIREEQKAGKLSFDIRAFLEEVVLVDLENSESHPLLIGRCLYVGGSYAEQMPRELRSKFLERTINCLNKQPTLVRICAAKAAASWLRTSSGAGEDNENDNLLVAQLPTLFQGLFDLGSQLTSREVLTIVLENFAVLTSIHKGFTVSVESNICTLTIRAFTDYGTRSVRQLCRDIFGNLMKNPECIQPLRTRLIPILSAKLAVNPLQDDILKVLELLLQQSHASQ